MNDLSNKFIDYLVSLRERDNGAIATVRHSLAFAPGTYPQAYPYVERFVSESWHAQDSRRLSLYVVAALFARHPVVDETKSFAKAFAEVCNKRNSPSLERRFIAILDADADTISDYLRHAISLLSTEGIGLDYVLLLRDLTLWMNSRRDLTQIREKWAREFYLIYTDRNEES